MPKTAMIAIAATLLLAGATNSTGAPHPMLLDVSNEAATWTEDFESGAMTAWQVTWFEDISPYCNDLNDWNVLPTDALGGEHALHLNSRCDNGNSVATTEALIRPGEPFMLKYDYLTNAANNRGGGASFLRETSEGTSPTNPIGYGDALPLVFPYNRSSTGPDLFYLLGEKFDLPPNTVTTGVKHTVAVWSNGATAQGFFDGSLVASVNLLEKTQFLNNEPMKLRLFSSGHWGQSSEIMFDDIMITSGTTANIV